MVCETSTSEEDWQRLKDYLPDAAISLDVKKVTYYVLFHTTLHFMGIRNRVKPCNIKSTVARKHVI